MSTQVSYENQYDGVYGFHHQKWAKLIWLISASSHSRNIILEDQPYLAKQHRVPYVAQTSQVY